MRLRGKCKNSPNQLLPLLLFLFLFLRLLDLFQPITNVISTEGGALCRRSGDIPVFSSLLLLLQLFLPLLVLRRHSERSEESPHFRGKRSDPSAFLFHHPNTVISTEAAHGLIVNRAAEKPACFLCQATKPPNPMKTNQI
jgi:hypothetical protein